MAYLLVAFVVSLVGIGIVLLRNRPHSSMGDSIREFEQGLEALAPREPPRPRAGERG